MANTYTLISSNVLASAAASVTFSSIPQTYTDLVLRVSLRDTTGGNYYSDSKITFTPNTGTGSWTRLRGIGFTASSGRGSGNNYNYPGLVDGASATANTFASGEIYIPNYTTTNNKPFSSFMVSETNDTTNNAISAEANLYQISNALTALTVTTGGTQFDIGSSFYLYGIKNA